MRFEYEMKIPSATKQQRKLAGGKSYPSPGLRHARATWQAVMEKHKPPMPFIGPVAVVLQFFYHRKGKPNDWKTTRPDLDNLTKIVIDAMLEADFFLDDAQVAFLTVKKCYTPETEKILCEVESLHKKKDGKGRKARVAE